MRIKEFVCFLQKNEKLFRMPVYSYDGIEIARGMRIVSRHFEWIECTRFVLFEWYGERW